MRTFCAFACSLASFSLSRLLPLPVKSCCCGFCVSTWKIALAARAPRKGVCGLLRTCPGPTTLSRSSHSPSSSSLSLSALAAATASSSANENDEGDLLHVPASPSRVVPPLSMLSSSSSSSVSASSSVSVSASVLSLGYPTLIFRVCFKGEALIPSAASSLWRLRWSEPARACAAETRGQSQTY